MQNVTHSVWRFTDALFSDGVQTVTGDTTVRQPTFILLSPEGNLQDSGKSPFPSLNVSGQCSKLLLALSSRSKCHRQGSWR